MAQAWDFEVSRGDLGKTRIHESALKPLEPGQVRLKIERFAFTANNITYAAMGDSMAYWRFFPAAEGWGRVPVWGFGTILESNVDELKAGERIYGYLPMGTHLTLQPVRITGESFVDATDYRQGMAAAYNLYNRCGGDPAYDAAFEDLQALLKPLYVTSFMIDDQLADNGFFGASQVIISSASSKTAFALAHRLKQRGKDAPRVIGLTAAANRAFVESLGCYDQAVTYDAMASLDASKPAVFVDMAGNGPVRNKLHQHFGDNMKFSLMVGLAHRDQRASMEGLPGAKPVLFFAPDRIKQRNKDWGREGMYQRIDDAWRPFVRAAKGWLTISEGRGQAAFSSTYRAMLDGKSPPADAQMLAP